MKARQSSVYRSQELLYLTLNQRFEKIPNIIHKQMQAAHCLIKLMSAMEHVDLALKTSDARARLEIFDVIVVEMGGVKLMVRMFYTKTHAKDPTIISHQQYAEIVKLFDKIARDLQKWIVSSQKEVK